MVNRGLVLIIGKFIVSYIFNIWLFIFINIEYKIIIFFKFYVIIYFYMYMMILFSNSWFCFWF